MNRMSLRVISSLVALCVAILSTAVNAQPYTEVRDQARGATYLSVQISTDSLSEIQAEGGRFSNLDEMTLGLSALFFDEFSHVTDFVMWLRHDGPRRWLTGDKPEPVNITMDNQTVELIPMHMSRPQQPPHEGPFIEKLEFSLSPELFRKVISSSAVTIDLRTFQGLVSKRLTDREIQILNDFQKKVQQRQEILQ